MQMQEMVRAEGTWGGYNTGGVNMYNSAGIKGLGEGGVGGGVGGGGRGRG